MLEIIFPHLSKSQQVDQVSSLAKASNESRSPQPHLLHSKRVSLFVVQVFLQVEECVEEYVGHPAALQIPQGDFTCRSEIGVRLEEIYTHTHTKEEKKKGPSWSLTLGFGLDQVQHLAQQVLEGQGFDAHPFHPLALLLVEVLQLKHGQDAVSVRVHAAEPVLDAEEGRGG